jgi:hypothetical protein
MKLWTESPHCPAWCVMHGARDHSPLWHGSEGSRLDLPILPGAETAESVAVRTAPYPSDDSDDPRWEPVVELAHHVEGRYRVIGLTPPAARHLARLLSQATDQAESEAGLD